MSEKRQFSCSQRFRWTDAACWAAVALLARVAVIVFAAERVPPTADGSFYHVVAGRIAAGHGYTWLWPDGVVTYAAHYPIGYPALIGGAYWLAGPHPIVAMLVNAAFGVASCVVAYFLGFELARATGLNGHARRAAHVAALLVALSPTLLFYTPALMTEGAVGTLLALAVAAGLRATTHAAPQRWIVWLLLSGLATGAATLLRPQSLLMGVVIGGAAGFSLRARANGAGLFSLRAVRGLLGAGLVSSVALLCCVPWTLRNCERMERCVLVSANGGWNLLIGTFAEAGGGFIGIDGERVPPECTTVFQEAEKDVCFGRAGRRRILEKPSAWLSLAPSKLRMTFDFTAAASDHWKMAGALDDRGAWFLSAAELIVQRLSFLLVALGVLRPDSKQRNFRSLILLLAGLALLFMGAGAYLAWLALLVWVALARSPQPFVVQAALAGVLVTIAVHAIFFGAGRYVIPLLVLLAPLSGLGWAWITRTFDRSARAG